MKILKRLAAAFLAAAIAMCSCTAAMAQTPAAENSESEPAYNRTCETPKANLAPDTYTTNKSVTLTCGTVGARIFYTLDGSYPTVYSTEYKKPIRIKGKEGESVLVNLRAIAVKTGYNESELLDVSYLIELPAPKRVIYMELYTLPNKTTYKKGDKLDVSGGMMMVTYEDHTYARVGITSKMISGFNTNTAGDKLLTVTYKGFTDTFPITVKAGTGVPDYEEEIDPNEIFKDDENDVDEDSLPQISGHPQKGWDNIRNSIEGYPEEGNVTIFLNGAGNIPADVIREAAKNSLKLTFVVEDDMSWKLDTSGISSKTITAAGCGIRTSAIYIPKNYYSNIGGTMVKKLHLNSDNTYSADFVFTTDKSYARQYASLFRYDSKEKTMTFIGCQKISGSGKATFQPQESGDYIIIVDTETKLKGDLSNNNKVNDKDFKHLFEAINSGKYSYKADVNSDGSVDMKDMKAFSELIKSE